MPRLHETEVEDGCAQTLSPDFDPTGTLTGASEVMVPPGRTGTNAQRSFAHEFGHLFGLYDFENACSMTKGIMAPRSTQTGGCESVPSDAALGPTGSDGAFVRSVYDPGQSGDHPRRVCGF